MLGYNYFIQRKINIEQNKNQAIIENNNILSDNINSLKVFIKFKGGYYFPIWKNWICIVVIDESACKGILYIE